MKIKDKPLQFRVNLKALLEEILDTNVSMQIMQIPFRTTYNIMQQIAKRAIELQDEKLITLLCALAMYEESDPYSGQYDAKKMERLFDKHLNPQQ